MREANGAGCGPAQALATRAPNAIYVVAETTWRVTMLMQTTAATPLPKTKRLLVDEGATFTAFAHVPICNPSRAATLTGKQRAAKRLRPRSARCTWMRPGPRGLRGGRERRGL